MSKRLSSHILTSLQVVLIVCNFLVTCFDKEAWLPLDLLMSPRPRWKWAVKQEVTRHGAHSLTILKWWVKT